MASTIDRTALSRVIAVINGKGGVFKTTLTANVGGILASSGYKVLLVDLDPQGNLAEDLGYTRTEQDDEGRALAQGLSFGGPVTPQETDRAGLFVLPGGHHLDQAAAGLAAKAQKDLNGSRLALAALLEPLAPEFDMILLDCPPGNEPLQSAAVAAARWALVPVKTDASSRKGLEAVAARLDSVVGLNPTLDLLGIVLVGSSPKATNIQNTARAHIREAFHSDSIAFHATVRHSEATAQATRERGVLVHELEDVVRKGPKWYEIVRGAAKAENHAPRSAGSVAEDLHAVTQELVTRITQAEQEELA